MCKILLLIAGFSVILAPSCVNSMKSDYPTSKYPEGIGRDTDIAYGGTIFIEPSLLNSDDVSAYESESTNFKGIECRNLFDRRVVSWHYDTAFIFVVTFTDNIKAEFQVHSEFESNTVARGLVDTYAELLGRLPAFMRAGIKVVQIVDGVEPWGGGGGTLTIHKGQGDEYLLADIAEEVMIHESGHAVLDPQVYGADWNQAVRLDDTYISVYAADNPRREDVAESILAWLGVTYRNDRLSSEDSDIINAAIPNRLGLFDDQNYDMYPLSGNPGFYSGSHGGEHCFGFEGDQVIVGFCFSSEAKVDVLGKGNISMADLAAGDNVLTTSGEYKSVYTINHFHSSMPTEFLQIHTDLEDNPLELTPHHLIFVEGLSYPIPALKIRVGDMLRSVNGPTEVVRIERITRNGLYNPITTDGTIVVDGIFASTYTSLTDSSHLEIANTKLLPVQTLVNMAAAPYRAFCMSVSLDLCNQHDELSGPSRALGWLYNFWSQQNLFIKTLMFLLYVSFFGPLSLFLNYYCEIIILSILWRAYVYAIADKN